MTAHPAARRRPSAPPRRRRQRGAALLTAMLIITMTTMLAAALQADYALYARRTERMLHSEQALQYALGAESWAMDILATDARDSQIDHRNEVWATALPALPIDGGVIEGALEDLQGRFNLNNLAGNDGGVDERALRQFERLLTAVGLDPALAVRAGDYIDANREEFFPNGAEDDYYTGLEPPYRPANTALTTPTELLAVAGFDAAAWRALRPYVTALPPGTTVNLNTASPPVLQSLGENVGPSEALGIFEQAATLPYEDIANVPGLDGEDVAAVAVNSSWFRLTVRVTVGSTLFTMYSLLERDANASVWPRFRTFYTE